MVLETNKTIVGSSLQVANTQEKHTSILLLFPKLEIYVLENKHIFLFINCQRTTEIVEENIQDTVFL